jgi:hypothetical protein
MFGSFAGAYIDPEYRDTLAAGLFATSRPTRRRMPRSGSQNRVEDGDDDMYWSTVTGRCQHNNRRHLSSRRLARRAHCRPGFPRVQRTVTPHANFRCGRSHPLTLACSSKTHTRERVHR